MRAREWAHRFDPDEGRKWEVALDALTDYLCENGIDYTQFPDAWVDLSDVDDAELDEYVESKLEWEEEMERRNEEDAAMSRMMEEKYYNFK